MRILVTGAAGFIGSHLSSSLLARGCVVRGVDCLTDTYPVAHKRANLAALRPTPGFEFVRCDLATADLAALLDGVSAVAHLAGEPGVSGSWGESFHRYLERNVLVTQRLLEAVTASAVRRVVYASSSSVYGPVQGRTDESALPSPASPYGASKLAAELLVGAYAQERGVSGVSLRYFSVYGPRQRPDMALHRFVEAALERRPVVVYGDGSQQRDFTYVGDVVAATETALTADLPPGAVVNVAGGEPATVADVLRLVGERLGEPVRVEHRPERPGDVSRTDGDAAAARALLGWEPRTPLRTGVARQVDWHLDRHALRRSAPVQPAPAVVVPS